MARVSYMLHKLSDKQNTSAGTGRYSQFIEHSSKISIQGDPFEDAFQDVVRSSTSSSSKDTCKGCSKQLLSPHQCEACFSSRPEVRPRLTKMCEHQDKRANKTQKFGPKEQDWRRSGRLEGTECCN